MILPHHSSQTEGPASPLASPDIWAKEQQLALLDLHQGAGALRSKSSAVQASSSSSSGGGGDARPHDDGAAGAWAGAAEAEAGGPFSIGTRVHRPGDADLV